MFRVLNLRRSLHQTLLHHHHRQNPTIPHSHPLKTLISSSSSTQNHKNPDLTRPFCSSTSSSSSSLSSSSSSDAELRKYLGYSALLLGCGVATYYAFPFPENAKHKKAQLFRYAPLPEDLHTVSNWSGTHEVQTRVFLQPESLQELESFVKDANEKKQKIRPVGSGLSPNGIGLTRSGMVNLALMDKVLEVDKEKKTVKVEAGIRVQQLVDEIKDYGLTLQNFASIREQQIGGIIQVGAHGTGARLPPIDEQVISMKLVTPAKGTIEVSKEKDPELFYLARCGLGGLGVVAEVTLQCVERQELVEHTVVSNMKEIKKNHKKLLLENKHVKYLYIPYTDTVVVVRCNPVSKWKGPPKFKPKYSKDEAIQHVRDLYWESLKKYRVEEFAAKSADDNEPDINELSFTELRDKLLDLDPLNKDHVIKVNQAEAEFWTKSEGYRVGWSDEILGFDCGGQQWVSEICFPAGTLAKPSMKDLEYIEELMQLIEKEEIPAPAPIEQRWTACSKSLMSPASCSAEDDIFSWVGIIMYLPTMDSRQRKQITEEFFHYRRLTQAQLWDQYSAYEHWAKIEVPKDKEELAALQARLRKHFPVDAYNKARRELDPNRILSNNVLEKLFPISDTI
uniref:Putative L-galactono-1,4-lactone dehydrogenase n=1 Tax=Davidia involucrata TaxID=16924 RepID=A0A5B7ASZ1_DAVIN